MYKPERLDQAVTPLTCREWQEIPIGDNGLTRPEADRFHGLAERAGRRLKLGDSGVLAPTSRGLKAQQAVGLLAIPGRTLEILPKIDGDDGAVRKALVYMIAMTRGLRVADGELATLATQRRHLLELLIRLFTGRLKVAIRRGLPHRYLTRREDLGLLRGRLDIKRQITHLAVRPDRLACRYDVLSEDTPLNWILKAAVSRLVRLATSAATVRSLSELLARLEHVSDARDPLREPVRLDRTNAAFHDVYRLARLFLSGDWQSTTSGDSAGFSLLFPMNDLFEAFVGQCVKRVYAGCPGRVHLQHDKHHALKGATGQPLFHLRPDIAVYSPHGCVIADTKWKRLVPKKGGEEKIQGVARSDLYQMLTYGQHYDASRIILIYPWHRGLDDPEGLNRRWTVAGTSRRMDVATVDVGCPERVVETLRGIMSPDGGRQPDVQGSAAK